MITIVNFSSSKDANCIKIAKQLSDYYHEKGVKIFSFDEFTLVPCGYCEYECVKKNSRCKVNDCLNEIYETISKSEEAIYILPNYCDYPCANFFIFNERSVGYYNNKRELREKYRNVPKKFIVISNSFEENFKKAFSYHVIGDPKILFLGAKKLGMSSLDKNLAEQDGVKKLINSFINEKYNVEKSAMAVVVYKNKILCTEEEIYGKITLSLPKGHIEKGESVIEAAIRECYEETNVVLTSDMPHEHLTPYEVMFTNHYFEIIKKVIYPVLFFVDEKGEPKAKEERISKVEYMDMGEFISKSTYKNIVEVVKEVFLKILEK